VLRSGDPPSAPALARLLAAGRSVVERAWLGAWRCHGGGLAAGRERAAARRWRLERRRGRAGRGGAAERAAALEPGDLERTEEGRRRGHVCRGRARCGAGAGEEVRPRGTGRRQDGRSQAAAGARVGAGYDYGPLLL
jgi:hypothetical protein